MSQIPLVLSIVTKSHDVEYCTVCTVPCTYDIRHSMSFGDSDTKSRVDGPNANRCVSPEIPYLSIQYYPYLKWAQRSSSEHVRHSTRDEERNNAMPRRNELNTKHSVSPPRATPHSETIRSVFVRDFYDEFVPTFARSSRPRFVPDPA